MKPQNDSVPKKLICYQSKLYKMDISSIDTSSILSFASRSGVIVYVTRDYKIKVLGGPKYLKKLVDSEIIDDDGCVWLPRSVLYNDSYTIILVSMSEKGYRTKLVLSYDELESPFVFLNTGYTNPVALYESGETSAVIDLNGAIHYFNYSIKNNPNKYIARQDLPEGEKAVDLALGKEYILALSSNGKLFMSKISNNLQFSFKIVKMFSKLKVTQISGKYLHFLVLTEDGRVFSYGWNYNGQLGIGSHKKDIHKFNEIFSLRRYKIEYVFAGYDFSIFQTINGQILGCGNDNHEGQFHVNTENKNEIISAPVETEIKSGAKSCFVGFQDYSVAIGFDAEMTSCRKVNDEIKVAFLGDDVKPLIQAFVNNSFDIVSTNNSNENEYKLKLDIDQSIVEVTIIDAFCHEKDNEGNIKNYQLAPYLLFCCEPKNLSMMNYLYIQAKKSWECDPKHAIILYNVETASKSPKDHYHIEKTFNCKVFEVFKNDIDSLNKSFYQFLCQEGLIAEKYKNIIKVGKEHKNPFNFIKKENINIGLFGDKNVDKTKLAFKYVYEDFYEIYYENYKTNFEDIELTKIVEVKNKIVSLSVIDSTFVNNINKSHFSAVQGIIYVFNIEMLSTSEYINKLKSFCNNGINSVPGIFIIAFEVEENQLNQYHSLYEKIDEIKKQLNCNVFLFSEQTNDIIQDMFNYAIKKIIQSRLDDKKLQGKKKKRK